MYIYISIYIYIYREREIYMYTYTYIRTYNIHTYTYICPTPRDSRWALMPSRRQAHAERKGCSLAEPPCHILPLSEIDWGLFSAAFTGLERRCLFHRID